MRVYAWKHRPFRARSTCPNGRSRSRWRRSGSTATSWCTAFPRTEARRAWSSPAPVDKVVRMTTLVDANNAASRLIHEGRLDEAERALDQIEALLQARAAVDVTIPATELDFVAAWDELIYSVHRVTLGLRRGAHVQSLPHAERAW